MPRPPLTQSMPPSNVTGTDEGHCITNALQIHALALHQKMQTPGIINTSDPRSLEPLTSPGEVSGTHPSSSSSKDISRSAGVSAPTIIANLKHLNAVPSQLSEVVKEQPESGSTRLHAQVAFVDEYPLRTSELLDRETPEGNKGIPEAETSAVLTIKQEVQGLIMPAQAAVQNQQEVSVAVQRSL